MTAIVVAETNQTEEDPPLFSGGGPGAEESRRHPQRQQSLIEQALKAQEGLLKGANEAATRANEAATQAVTQVQGAVAGIVGKVGEHLQPGKLSQAKEEQVRRDEREKIQEQLQIEEQLKREEEERKRQEEEERRQKLIAERRSRWEQDWWLKIKGFKPLYVYKFKLLGETHQIALSHQAYSWTVMCDEVVIQEVTHQKSFWGRDNCQVVFKVQTADESQSYEAVMRMTWTSCGMQWRYELEVNGHVVPVCWSRSRDQRKKQVPEVKPGGAAAA
mmetsp:Transcript_1869/g.4738  ORF Transcript_1869/g.4738 Transcript_1869/m.4738 type:complete len:274 (-) Transcript_1869:101-922(-)